MFVMSDALDPQTTAGGSRGPVVHWTRSRSAGATTDLGRFMADLRAANTVRLIVDATAGTALGDEAAVVAAAVAAGLPVEVAMPADVWTEQLFADLGAAGLTRATVSVGNHTRPTLPAWARKTRNGASVGVQLQLARDSAPLLPAVMDVVERNGLQGLDVAHSVPDGQFDWLRQLPTRQQARQAMQALAARTVSWQARRQAVEVRTWFGPVDPIYTYLWCLRHVPPLAGRALASARSWASIRPNEAFIDGAGNVYAVRGAPFLTLGSLRKNSFASLWNDRALPGWRATLGLAEVLGPRCAVCPWHRICGGGERPRAFAAGDVKGPDPGCYLNEREVAAGPGPDRSGEN